MKGTWQAMSLSSGQLANGKRLDFKITGWQIDSWPARSLSRCKFADCYIHSNKFLIIFYLGTRFISFAKSFSRSWVILLLNLPVNECFVVNTEVHTVTFGSMHKLWRQVLCYHYFDQLLIMFSYK